MSWLETTCRFLCTIEDSALASVGVDPHFVQLTMFAATMGSTVGFLALWMHAFPRLRRHGFSKLVWNLTFWFVLLMGLYQVVQLLLPRVGLQAVPCPYTLIVPAVLAALFCAIAYSVHLWKGNKGSLSEFFVFVVTPAVGETVAASKAVAAFVVKIAQLVPMPG